MNRDYFIGFSKLLSLYLFLAIASSQVFVFTNISSLSDNGTFHHLLHR